MPSASESQLRPLIEQAFEDRSKLQGVEYREAVEETIEMLDKGKLRVSTQGDSMSRACESCLQAPCATVRTWKPVAF